jgi:hypothetical protein
LKHTETGNEPSVCLASEVYKSKDLRRSFLTCQPTCQNYGRWLPGSEALSGATAASIDVHFRYALTPMECGTFADRGDLLDPQWQVRPQELFGGCECMYDVPERPYKAVSHGAHGCIIVNDCD